MKILNFNKLTDYLERDGDTNLLHLHYDLTMPMIEDDGFDFDMIDEILGIEVSDDSLTYRLSRKIVFASEKPFDVQLIVQITHFVKEDFIGKVKWDNYDITKEIFDNQRYFNLDIIGGFMSLIIAQTTSAFGNSPLIVPPEIVELR